jgi:hypothetical protein
MIANRILASAACVPLLAALAAGQTFTAPPPTSLFPGRGNAVRLAGDEQPVATPAGGSAPLTAPQSMDTLTGSPVPLPTIPNVPLVPSPVPGAVYSPWCGDTPAGACCGPTGANGPVTYDVYARTGVSLLTGGGKMTAVTKTFGWNMQIGARTLFFNPTGDAAWVLDLGFGRTNNAGRGAASPVDINQRAVKNVAFGDGTTFAAGVTEVRRTSFNFGLGRDYFLNGPGVADAEGYGNFRAGWDVGGRWGTASVDLEPFVDPGGNRRRQDVYHGLYVAGQGTWEQPMGSWTLFFGGRVEWGYYWTNLLPPNDGDFRDVNLLLIGGVRF